MAAGASHDPGRAGVLPEASRDSARRNIEDRELHHHGDRTHLLLGNRDNAGAIVTSQGVRRQPAVGHVAVLLGRPSHAVIMRDAYSPEPARAADLRHLGHFKAIADAVDIPIIVYNVPGRTVANISVETLARLSHDCKNIIGTKDASADLTRPSRQRQFSRRSSFS